ncbi:MAG: lysophospholipid acyltransferase family protein [Myxococcota bacterium]|nr:lysophospholipid acyltransferase family protein [Myxococcota bacterium]
MTEPLGRGELRALAIQRHASAVLAPLWVTLCLIWMRSRGWKLEGADETRELFRRLRRESSQPIMVCANHLTLVDSFLIAWALGDLGSFLRRPSSIPWNTPETRNFAHGFWQRALAWMARCLPVTRGGDRSDVAKTLARVGYVLERGDPVLMFPEGGRSRSGRVDPKSGAWGVGRLVRAVPDCRVLCLYLRGHSQQSWSSLPKRGERFHVSAVTLEPKSDRRGLRASVEVARQITRRLSEMEEQVLGAPEPGS